MKKSRRMLHGGWLRSALAHFTRGWFGPTITDVITDVTASDAAAYALTISDTEPYTVTAADAATYGVTAADVEPYTATASDDEAYDVTISEASRS